MHQSPASPSRRTAFSPRAILLVLPVALAVPALAWSVLPGGGWKSEESGPLLHVVSKADFIHDITERGEVESASNVEVRCEVSNQGGSGTMIIEIIPEGTYVQGPKIVTSEEEAAQHVESTREGLQEADYLGVVLEVMSEDIKDKDEVGGIVRQVRTGEDARAAFRKIMESVKAARPEARIDGVQIEQILVKLDSANLEEQLTQQQIVCNTSQAVVIQAQNTYDTAVIAMQEYEEGTYVQQEQKLQSAEFVAKENLRKAEQTLLYSRTLLDKGYVTPAQLQADTFAVENYRKSLDSAVTELKVLRDFTKKKMLKSLDSDIKTAEAKLQAEEHSHQLDTEKLKRIKGDLDKCLIRAHESGQVVYANQTDYRGGSEFIVEEGATVRERQVIIRLPDPKRMQVKGKINEAHVSLVRTGMRASIRLDAFAEMALRGSVQRVSDYPAPTSFFSSNVKEYETIVKIEDEPDGLRPGLTAEVKIRVAELDDVITVPVQTVFQHGRGSYCVVPRGDQYEAREVELGPTNDKVVVIQSGLKEGEQVVMGAAAFRDKVELPALPPEGKMPGMSPGDAVASPAGAAPGASSDGGPGAAGAAGTAGPGGPGEGGGRRPQSPDAAFAGLDTNGDGKIDSSELSSAPDFLRAGITAADTNKDGATDKAEFTAAMQRLMSGRGGPGGGPGGPGGPGGRPDGQGRRGGGPGGGQGAPGGGPAGAGGTP